MEIIVFCRLLPGEKQVLTVKMKIRITIYTVFVRQQCFFLRPDTIHLNLRQRTACKVVALCTGIGNAFGIGKERRTQRSELRKNNLRLIGSESFQTFGTSSLARFQIRLESRFNTFRSIIDSSSNIQFLHTKGKLPAERTSEPVYIFPVFYIFRIISIL